MAQQRRRECVVFVSGGSSGGKACEAADGPNGTQLYCALNHGTHREGAV
jgi:hypothetical protein